MNGPPNGRVPPNNQAAERAVLGGVLLEAAAFDVARELLDPRDFYRDAHAIIWEAMLDLGRRGEPIDSVTLRARLETAKKLERAGGDEYLLALTDTIPTVANIEAHAKLVRGHSVQRAVIHVCHTLAAEGYDGVEDTADYTDRALRAMAEVAARRGNQLQARRLGDATAREYNELARRSAANETVQGYRTGFHDLDEALSGLVPKDLIVLAARPAMGKTALANELRLGLARTERLPVVSLELEMSEQQLAQRNLSIESGVGLRRIRSAALGEHDFSMLAKASDEISRLPIFFVEQRGAKLSEFKRAAAAVRREHGELGLITIDYLQIARAEKDRESRENEVSQLSAEAKNMAGEFKCPVVALSQLNRGVEQRQDKRPVLSDLRESGAIEQDADTILFLYREEVYNPKTPKAGIAEVIVAKQRSGPTGTVELKWTREMTRFANLEKHRQEAMF